MTPETIITINIGAGVLIIGIIAFFLSLLAIVWKGKKEISETVKQEIKPFRQIANTIIEIQSILVNKFKGLKIIHTLVESGSSPLNPTEYGASLIKESGLEKILDDNKVFFKKKLEGMLSKDYTEYDIQEKARELLVYLQNDPMMNPVKKYVYENPIDMEIILRAGGLWLRDDFLNKERGISKDKTS